MSKHELHNILLLNLILFFSAHFAWKHLKLMTSIFFRALVDIRYCFDLIFNLSNTLLELWSKTKVFICKKTGILYFRPRWE